MTKIELARGIIERYIEIGVKNNTQYSKRFIATVLHSENPDQFQTIEDARGSVRDALNAKGCARKRKSSEELARRFAIIPPQVHELRNTEPFVIPTGVRNALWIADVHSRFYDRKALEIAINSGINNRCDSVIILGDFMDFYGYSKFDKNPMTVAQFEDEREWGQDILKLLQDTFGYVVLKEGNHDIRRQLNIQRLSASMPELMDLASYSDSLFFDGCHVNFVEDHRHIRYGKLNGIHGHEYYGGGGVHVAHNRLNKTFESVISAHSHVGQSKIKPTINGAPMGSWTIGCLCDLSPRYNPKNEWTHGFAVTRKDSTGDFEVENKIIYSGKVFSV